jgi:hypothetical protein
MGSQSSHVRFVRAAVVATLVVGAVVAIVTEWSFASQPLGQVGYGAPQQLPDQVINGSNASSSHIGLWIGVAVAIFILASTAFFGWRKTHSSEYP